jgi:CRP-like cAMP-binding protein
MTHPITLRLQRRAGRAARDGRPLREMSTGDSFGEIALLRRIPRTATVTAVSRVQAAFLGRDEFLAAVTGCPESTQSAEEVVSSRLKAG